MRKAFYVGAGALGLFTAASQALAAPVVNWHTYKASPATVISGETTNSPTLGSLATTSSPSRLLGYFSPQTLVNTGDAITLTFSVTFDDVTGMASGQDNFRFALFHTNGEGVETTLNSAANGSTFTEDLRGYIIGADTATNTPQGSTRKRVNSTSNDPFAAATASALGGANTGTDVTLASAVNGGAAGPTYAAVLTVTKTAAGIDLTGSFTGNGGANAFSISDNSSPVLTFDVVGLLNGGAISADVVQLSNVDVTYTPEPACLGVVALAGLGLARRRRRRPSHG